MAGELGIIILGDIDSKIYSAFNDPEIRNQKKQKMNRANDLDVQHRSSTCVTFNKIQHNIVHVDESYEFSASLNARSEDEYLYNENLTILIDISGNRDLTKYYKQIDQIKFIRGNDRPFNIMPIYGTNLYGEETSKFLKKYPDSKREIEYNPDYENYKELFTRVQEVSLATPVYRELTNLTQELDKLNMAIAAVNLCDNNIYIKEIDSLSELLNNAKKCSGKNSLSQYFQDNGAKMNSQVSALKRSVDTKFGHNHRIKHIFYNILCSIAYILAFCSILGTYHAYQQFSRNIQNHGSRYKFFATTPGEQIQESYASVENAIKGMNRPI